VGEGLGIDGALQNASLEAFLSATSGTSVSEGYLIESGGRLDHTNGCVWTREKIGERSVCPHVSSHEHAVSLRTPCIGSRTRAGDCERQEPT
jgi:hypothetical protein